MFAAAAASAPSTTAARSRRITGGIFVQSGGSIGAIDNSGSISANNAGGIFVSNGGSIGAIDNSGTISANTYGIFVYNGTIDSITNESGGTISGGNGVAIYYSGLTAPTALLIKGGKIIGDVTDTAATPTYSSVTIDGNFTTDGNFTVSSFTLDSGSALTIGSGNTIGDYGITFGALSAPTTITLDSGSHIIGDVTDGNAAAGHSAVTVAGNFATQGNFTVSSFGIAAGKTLEVSTGNTITTRTLTTNGGTLTFGVTSTANHGEIVISNGAATLTGETITVDVSGNGGLAVGNKILIINGSSALVGGPGSTFTSVSDNDPFLNFDIVDGTGAGIGGNADQLYLKVLAGPSNGTISTAYTGPLSIPSGDSLVVTDTGSVAGGSSGVIVNGVTAGSIDNSGSISANNTGGIFVSNGTIDSVTNESGGTISANNSGGIYVS